MVAKIILCIRPKQPLNFFFLLMVYLKQCFISKDYVPVLASPDYVFHLNDDLNELQYAKV